MDQNGSAHPTLATVGGKDSSAGINPGTIGSAGPGRQGLQTNSRVLAMVAVARHHGVDLPASEFRPAPGEAVPSPAALVGWARDQGLWAKAERVRWKALFKLQGAGSPPAPVILLFKDGAAGLLAGSDAARNIVWLRNPQGGDPVPVDELRLAQSWTGEVVLVRRLRAEAEADQPFSLRWLLKLVFHEKKTLRDVSIASITLSALTIVPPLLVMTVVDRVVVHNSYSTLVLLSAILGITAAYECLLGYTRRELVQVVSTRVDAKLNLHIFNRLLALPLDYFEKTPAGETNYRLSQVWKIREFLTGKLMGTALDSFTLVFLLPFLFWMQADPGLDRAGVRGADRGHHPGIPARVADHHWQADQRRVPQGFHPG